jgi:hypothetical protein
MGQWRCTIGQNNVAAQHLKIMIQKQARKLDLPTDVRTNHFGEVVKNWIGLAF